MKSFAVAALLLVVSPSLAEKVEVTNNQPFDIAMPWKLLDGKMVMVNVAASGKQTIDAAVVALNSSCAASPGARAPNRKGHARLCTVSAPSAVHRTRPRTPIAALRAPPRPAEFRLGSHLPRAYLSGVTLRQLGRRL